MPVARVAAQAKVNLILRVGHRRPDGFHDIFTMFQLVDLADEVVVRIGGAGRTLHVAGARIPEGGLGPTEKNLAHRAAIAYAARCGWPNGFSIELLKNIPAGGGLGGGSSDAGAVLRALNALNERPMSQADLYAVASTLGSDVAFFVSGSACALATGRGEDVHEWEPLPSRDVLLVIPTYGISTPDAYGWLDADRADARKPASALLPDPERAATLVGAAEPPAGFGTWKLMEAASHNDFEHAVERRHPDLRAIRERLARDGATIARLSGSGSTVFGVFEQAPMLPMDLAASGTLVLRTRTSTRVVQVEVQE